MKKISGFMVAVMFCVMLASSIIPGKEVQAFSESQIDYGDFNWRYSAKAGTQLYFSTSLDYATANEVDLTGWKAALCPAGNVSLEDAVVTFAITNENKYINAELQYAAVNLQCTLASDIPEGSYKQVIFDAQGNVKYEDWTERTFINQSMVNFTCDTMNNDGYAYAYVYADNIPLSADTYPTFYGADMSTAVTSFNDYTVENTQYGPVHIYRLNILNDSEFTFDENGLAYLYYRVNGGMGTNRVNAAGLDWANAFNLNNYVEKYGMDVQVISPFDGTSSVDTTVSGNDASNSDNEDDDDNDEVTSSSDNRVVTTTVGNQTVEVTVTTVQASTNQAVQSSINSIVDWTNRIAAQPSSIATVLNQYAPALHVSNVVAGGTLELMVPGNTDLSAGANITFTDSQIAANVRRGDTVAVLHVKHDGTIEYLPATAGDGTITATFTSLSPVAWFKVESGKASGKISPKTGESFWDFLFH